MKHTVNCEICNSKIEENTLKDLGESIRVHFDMGYCDEIIRAKDMREDADNKKYLCHFCLKLPTPREMVKPDQCINCSKTPGKLKMSIK